MLPSSYLESFNFGSLETISNDTGVQTLRDEAVSLLQELAHKQNDRGSAIAADVVLGGRSSGNHNGSRVLYLHFTEKNVTIFGKLNLCVGPELAMLRTLECRG
jgi:hypothetical protein